MDIRTFWHRKKNPCNPSFTINFAFHDYVCIFSHFYLPFLSIRFRAWLWIEDSGSGHMHLPAELMASVEAAALFFPASLLLSLIPCLGLITKALHLLSPAHCFLYPSPPSQSRDSPTLLPTVPWVFHVYAFHTVFHSSPANSYSSLKAQLGKRLRWDVCPDFPVGSRALFWSLIVHTSLRHSQAPSQVTFCFPWPSEQGHVLCFWVTRPAKPWYTE